MSNLNTMIKRQSLERDISVLHMTIEKEKEKLERLQKDCKHEVVVILEKGNTSNIDIDFQMCQRCLFCGKYISGTAPKNIIIDVSNTSNYNLSKKYDLVTKLFHQIDAKHPNYSLQEICDEIEIKRNK